LSVVTLCTLRVVFISNLIEDISNYLSTVNDRRGAVYAKPVCRFLAAVVIGYTFCDRLSIYRCC